jgi:hypothetical protein
VEANNLFRMQLAANANFSEIVRSWMNLQRRVVLLFDSSKAIGIYMAFQLHFIKLSLSSRHLKFLYGIFDIYSEN